MSRKGLSMRKAREILRLRLGIGLPMRQVTDSCKVSVGTVSEYEKRIKAAGSAGRRRMIWTMRVLCRSSEQGKATTGTIGHCRI